jgi:arabinose-5-phosphate isomerase
LVLDTARRVLEIESMAVRQLADRLGRAFEDAVEIILACEGRVIVTGMGKSGLICQKIAATFSSTGVPSHFVHPAEALHGDLGMIVKGDVTLALSNSGETSEMVRLVELIRRLGAKIVSMTGDPESTLARHADVHLHTGVDREACSLDLVPTASTTAALAMGDALVVACHEKRGFTARDFARFHPGGRLGRKLVQVGELMHRNAETPAVTVDTPMRQAVREMSEKHLGMTCVVEEDGRLVGVLTDGDLRRLLMTSDDPLSGTAVDAMTRKPVTIAADALATEALHMMEQKKITSLPVLDPEGKVLGVIQIHDLWRTELF